MVPNRATHHICLTHFWPIFSFKHHKTKGFPVFSGGSGGWGGGVAVKKRNIGQQLVENAL